MHVLFDREFLFQFTYKLFGLNLLKWPSSGPLYLMHTGMESGTDLDIFKWK